MLILENTDKSVVTMKCRGKHAALMLSSEEQLRIEIIVVHPSGMKLLR